MSTNPRHLSVATGKRNQMWQGLSRQVRPGLILVWLRARKMRRNPSPDGPWQNLFPEIRKCVACRRKTEHSWKAETILTHDGRIVSLTNLHCPCGSRTKNSKLNWLTIRLNPGRNSEHTADREVLRRDIYQRGIRRLCHFTSFQNLRTIISTQAIASQSDLARLGIPCDRNDLSRFDGHRDLISVSIEHPNVYLLSSWAPRGAAADTWVILFLKPELLLKPKTLFSQRNAARGKGLYLKEGIDGFRKMYEDVSSEWWGTRTEMFLPSAPTDIQAEVMIPSPISIDWVTCIVVKSEIAKLQVQETLNFTNSNIPIVTDERFFNVDEVKKAVKSGSRLEVSIGWR